MTAKHVLVVCEACNLAANQEQQDGKTDGARLLEQVQSLHERWSRRDELAIATTTCLCNCILTAKTAWCLLSSYLLPSGLVALLVFPLLLEMTAGDTACASTGAG